jgi:ATP-dependent Zn protease
MSHVQVADLTIGYSGAELANLLNEGAILAVRQVSCPCLSRA